MGFLAACGVFGEAARQMSCVSTCRRRRNEFAEARPLVGWRRAPPPETTSKIKGREGVRKRVNQQA
jgi:hypothetical protein